jgi:four helix bundle suffix protein
MSSDSIKGFIPPHGGYRKLISFQVAELVYDITVRFCEKYISFKSRTRDQMVQAARSGVQNIAEGSVASATSKSTEIKLTNVARASLEELMLDYEDFLRHRKLPLWSRTDSRRVALIAMRAKTADEVAAWIGATVQNKAEFPEYSANVALVLIGVASAMLKRQIKRLETDFLKEGGIRERMTKARINARKIGNHG